MGGWFTYLTVQVASDLGDEAASFLQHGQDVLFCEGGLGPAFAETELWVGGLGWVGGWGGVDEAPPPRLSHASIRPCMHACTVLLYVPVSKSHCTRRQCPGRPCARAGRGGGAHYPPPRRRRGSGGGWRGVGAAACGGVAAAGRPRPRARGGPWLLGLCCGCGVGVGWMRAPWLSDIVEVPGGVDWMEAGHRGQVPQRQGQSDTHTEREKATEQTHTVDR